MKQLLIFFSVMLFTIPAFAQDLYHMAVYSNEAETCEVIIMPDETWVEPLAYFNTGPNQLAAWYEEFPIPGLNFDVYIRLDGDDERIYKMNLDATNSYDWGHDYRTFRVHAGAAGVYQMGDAGTQWSSTQDPVSSPIPDPPPTPGDMTEVVEELQEIKELTQWLITTVGIGMGILFGLASWRVLVLGKNQSRLW